MCFVDENARVMRLCHIEHLLKISEIAVHRINALDYHQLTPALLTAQCHVERGGIVMLEFLRATPRQNRAITKTQVGSIVENGDIAFAQQTRDRAQRASKSAVEKHGVLAVEKFRNAAFEFAMEIGHA